MMRLLLILIVSIVHLQAAVLPFGSVYELKGTVKLYRKLRPIGIEVEQSLQHRDRVKTDIDSTLGIDVYDGTQIVVSPETRMTLTRGDVQEKKQINLQLLSGTIRCKVTPLNGEETFQIRTPVAVVGVRGTDFVTSYDRQNGLKITVLEGEVEIISLKEIQGQVRAQTMKINEEIRLNDNFDFSPKTTLPPSERQKIENNLPLNRNSQGKQRQQNNQGENEAEESDAQSDSNGKVRVRRIKQTIKSVTTQTQQNLFRDTINQAQRQADEAALQLQFNLVTP